MKPVYFYVITALVVAFAITMVLFFQIPVDLMKTAGPIPNMPDQNASVPQEDVEITINGINSTYVTGQPVNFGIEVKGYGHCDYPSVLVIRDGVILWKSRTGLVSCAFTMSQIDDKYTLSELGGPFYANQSGTYSVHVGYGSKSTQVQFYVASSGLKLQTNPLTKIGTSNPVGVTALVTYSPPTSCLGPVCPPDTFYLKINSNSTAYLRGYDICGSDLCVQNSTLSILLPINNIQIANYTTIGLSENKKWNYGDTVDIRLEISPSPDGKNSYLLDIKNSTIVP